MKIAIPTNDGMNLSSHFGRCHQFLIFEADNQGVNLLESRVNPGCHGHHDAAAGAEQETHAGFVGLLRDCNTVLCSGIGAGALSSLQAGGIQVVLVNASGSAREVVSGFLAGTLRPSVEGMCQCHH